MANTVKKLLFGPYVGFYYNGHHSAEFGICRVIDGDRYTINLAPTYNDITSERLGWDGTWYERTEVTSETFDINFASDVIDQETLDELKEWLAPGKASTLVFDETPYRGVSAVVTGNPTFDFIPFGKNGERTLKGSGKISFITYEPEREYEKTYGGVGAWSIFNYIASADGAGLFDRYYSDLSTDSKSTMSSYSRKICALRMQAELWKNSIRSCIKWYKEKGDYFDWVSEWWDGAMAYGIRMGQFNSGLSGYDNVIVNSDGSNYTYSPHKPKYKDDYVGFFFNGHHSSEFGLVRIATSEMYSENLLPSYDNIVKKGLAANKSFFFNKHATSKIIDISFATDNLSIGDLERLKQWIYPSNYGEFYLDNEPNTRYLAKLYGNPTFSFVPFASQEKVYFKDRTSFFSPDRGGPIKQRTDGRTIHKGEGKISFIIYEPAPQKIYQTVKEIGLDICDGGPYYGHLSGRFWKEEENATLKNIFLNWTGKEAANTSVNSTHKETLKDFIDWINEWKGLSEIPLVKEETILQWINFYNSNFNYKMILNLPANWNKDSSTGKELLAGDKFCTIDFGGRYKTENGYANGDKRLQLSLYYTPFTSSLQPNVIVIDSLKNLVQYGQKTDETITILRNISPISFVSVSERSIDTVGSFTTTHGILPTSFPCDRGQITVGNNYSFDSLKIIE